MIIEKLPEFDNDALSVLRETFNGYEREFKIEIESGSCELWRIDYGDAYAITRIENERSGPCLVVCCFAGSNIRQFARHVIKICDNRGWSIRMHTDNKTIIKLMLRNYQFKTVETILKRG